MFATFSTSNELIIIVSTYCSFVKMTLYCLNPNLVLNLWANVVLQSIITLISNFLSITFLLHYFSGLYNSSYLCFSWFGSYFIVISRKYLWSNPSYICFSFNQHIPSLSTNVPIPFLLCIFLLISIFINLFCTEVWGLFLFLRPCNYVLLAHYLLKQIRPN